VLRQALRVSACGRKWMRQKNGRHHFGTVSEVKFRNPATATGRSEVVISLMPVMALRPTVRIVCWKWRCARKACQGCQRVWQYKWTVRLLKQACSASPLCPWRAYVECHSHRPVRNSSGIIPRYSRRRRPSIKMGGVINCAGQMRPTIPTFSSIFLVLGIWLGVGMKRTVMLFAAVIGRS